MSKSVDDRSPTAKALSKVTEITTISLMMIIPAIIGYFIDQYFGTVILFTAIGLVMGIGAAIWQLIAFVSSQKQLSSSAARKLRPLDDSDFEDSDADQDETEEEDEPKKGGW